MILSRVSFAISLAFVLSIITNALATESITDQSPDSITIVNQPLEGSEQRDLYVQLAFHCKDSNGFVGTARTNFFRIEPKHRLPISFNTLRLFYCNHKKEEENFTHPIELLIDKLFLRLEWPQSGSAFFGQFPQPFEEVTGTNKLRLLSAKKTAKQVKEPFHSHSKWYQLNNGDTFTITGGLGSCHPDSFPIPNIRQSSEHHE